MRNIQLSLIPIGFLLIIAMPAAAEPSRQSELRAPATASAQIVSGESVRFGPAAATRSANRGHRGPVPTTRTRGKVLVAGNQHIMLTEFH